MSNVIYKTSLRLDVKYQGFSYQKEALESLRDLEYGAIFHEQGLGKTKIAIDLLLTWLEPGGIDTVILVVKKNLIQNWLLELQNHCFIKPQLLTQNKADNFYIFNSPVRLILAHYEVLRVEESRVQLFSKTRKVGVILDESAKIKNPDSQITQSFFRLSQNFERRIIMTGTPMANRPYDIWSQIFFLDQGKSLGSDFGLFKHNLDLTNDMWEDRGRQEAFERTVSEVYEKIHSFCVRENKDSDIISLPDKVYRNIPTDWENIQFDLYEQVRNEMKAVVVQEGFPTEDDSENFLKRLLRLLQIASNPSVIDQDYNSEPGKLGPLSALLAKIVRQGEKAIVWSSFIENINYLHLHFSDYGATKVHGKIDLYDRNRQIERFKKDPDAKVLFATPGAAKEGLTLTVANHVIFYDRGFSLDDYLQAQDRIHRISQTRECYVYNLIMKNSIDEWVDALLQAKHLAARLGQNDISLEYFQSQISYGFGEIVRNILKLD